MLSTLNFQSCQIAVILTLQNVVANVSLSQNTFHTTRLGSQADLDINLLNISRAFVTH